MTGQVKNCIFQLEKNSTDMKKHITCSENSEKLSFSRTWGMFRKLEWNKSRMKMGLVHWGDDSQEIYIEFSREKGASEAILAEKQHRWHNQSCTFRSLKWWFGVYNRLKTCLVMWTLGCLDRNNKFWIRVRIMGVEKKDQLEKIGYYQHCLKNI